MFFPTFLILVVLVNVYEFVEIDNEDWNIFIYSGKVKSERDLQTCKERQVCSVVHKRFWFPRQVERFCQCETGDCPSIWSDGQDNYTMTLNNRAQLKFCEPVTQLPACNESLFLLIENKTTENDQEIVSKAECHCPLHQRWVDSIQLRNGSSFPIQRRYRCSRLAKCKADELCGWERTDYYETYYSCSCPEGHLCVRRNDTQHDVNKLFYIGPAYKTFCSKLSNILLNFAAN